MHAGLAGRHIAFLATDGVDEDELRVPWRLLEEAGAALALVAPEGESIRGSRPDASSGDMRVTCPLDVAHEPDFADYAARFPVDLQLSGHSHGGQVRLPGIGAMVLPRMAEKYPLGLNRVGALQVYTNRGLGVINPPVRFNCPPEVTFVTLFSVFRV